MKLWLPHLLSGLQGKSQIVQDELMRLGESMVTTSEGTRAITLELCREFEDKFLLHITTDEVVAIATAALEGFNNEAKKMVVALVDMERAFVPPQYFIHLVQRRMKRQRREEELKGKSSKKGQDAEQSILNQATSPQTHGSLKPMKEEKKEKENEKENDKSGQAEKEGQEGSGLKTAGLEGEITAVRIYQIKRNKGILHVDVIMEIYQ